MKLAAVQGLSFKVSYFHELTRTRTLTLTLTLTPTLTLKQASLEPHEVPKAAA